MDLSNSRWLLRLVRTALVFFMLFIFILPGVQCGSASESKVRIGYLVADLHHLPLFVALEQGFFEDEGIEVEVIGPFDAGTAEMNAMAANQEDMGYVGTPPAVIAAARDNNLLSIVAGVNTEGSALVVDDTITSISDLRNKKIATPSPGSIQYVMMAMLLANNNMSFDDLEILPGTIKPPDMVASLKTGNINGYFVWEPYAASSVVSGAGKILVESKDIWPGHPCCVLVTRQDFAMNNPDKVEKVVRAHKRAIAFISEEPEIAKSIAVKYTNLSKDIIEEALLRVIYDYAVDVEGTKKFVQEIISLGESGIIKPIIQSTDIPDIDAFINAICDVSFQK